MFSSFSEYKYTQIYRESHIVLNHAQSKKFCFGLALMFHKADARAAAYFTIGTHFLWHVFSAVGGYFILQYLYIFRVEELDNQKAPIISTEA